MKYLITLLIVIFLNSCDFRVKPDFTKDGHDYVIRNTCVESHVENKYGYHYGYSIMHGKFCWHFGNYDETICDTSRLDTIEVNIKKKKI
jgi:hypothetical protein